MKRFYAVTLLALVTCSFAQAQLTLNFTITQYTPLIATRGYDTTVKTGAMLRLGSTIAALGGSGTYQYAWTPTSGLDSPSIARPLATIDTNITYTLTVTDAVTRCSQTAKFGI